MMIFNWTACSPGLPDGLFSCQKIPIWVNFGGSLNGKCWYIYDHLEYFTAIWYILLPCGIICVHLVYYSRFGMFGPRKIWQPWRSQSEGKNPILGWIIGGGNRPLEIINIPCRREHQ
jgi:hypothetical protein